MNHVKKFARAVTAGSLSARDVEAWLNQHNSKKILSMPYDKAIRALVTLMDQSYNEEIRGVKVVSLNQVAQGIAYAEDRIGGSEYKIMRGLKGKQVVEWLAQFWSNGARTMADAVPMVRDELRKSLMPSHQMGLGI